MADRRKKGGEPQKRPVVQFSKGAIVVKPRPNQAAAVATTSAASSSSSTSGGGATNSKKMRLSRRSLTGAASSSRGPQAKITRNSLPRMHSFSPSSTSATGTGNGNNGGPQFAAIRMSASFSPVSPLSLPQTRRSTSTPRTTDTIEPPSTSQPPIPSTSTAVPTCKPKRKQRASTALSTAAVANSLNPESNGSDPILSWTQGTVIPADLKKLNTDAKNTILLVDCRDPCEFKKLQILSYSNVVNVPGLKDISADAVVSFATKPAVIHFLQEHCSQLLFVLNAPGFYTHIVVFDETSTAEKCFQPVVTILTALAKWNENSRTATRLLQDGFSNVFQHHKAMVGKPENKDRLLWSCPPTISELSPFPKNPTPTPTEVIETVCIPLQNAFNLVVKKLDMATDMTRELIRHQKNFNSFLAIKVELQRATTETQPNITIPDDMKCPVCYDMFSQEIFQCPNGHCICSTCYTCLTSCPECRVPYPNWAGKIRNRALERIISNMAAVDCPFSSQGCQEKLSYKEVATHVKNCEQGKCSAVSVLEEQLQSMEEYIEISRKKLANLTKDLARTEQSWKVAMRANQNVPKTSPYLHTLLEQIFTKKVALVNLDMALDMTYL